MEQTENGLSNSRQLPLVSLEEQDVSSGPRVQLETQKIIVIGAGIAGTEAATHLAQNSRIPIEITSVEVEPTRREGGWAFQSFPNTETTNLAARKMYLGRDPEEIFRFLNDTEARGNWPAEFRNLEFDPDKPIPRALMQHYARWRQARVENELADYKRVTGEAMRVLLNEDKTVTVQMRDGRELTANRVVMASGSIAVKVPEYMQHLRENPNFIVDPLTKDGHARRAEIPQDARVLILGTGLTGEEQCSVLLKSGHTNLTMLSRGGRRHFRYPEKQLNKELVLDQPPEFLMGETPEEISERWEEFLDHYGEQGYTNEDIFKAILPHWESMRKLMGGCERAMQRLFDARRMLAT